MQNRPGLTTLESFASTTGKAQPVFVVEDESSVDEIAAHFHRSTLVDLADSGAQEHYCSLLVKAEMRAADRATEPAALLLPGHVLVAGIVGRDSNTEELRQRGSLGSEVGGSVRTYILEESESSLLEVLVHVAEVEQCR